MSRAHLRRPTWPRSRVEADELGLQAKLLEKELEVRVLNQMIVSANKMVQVKTAEVARLTQKAGSRPLGTIQETQEDYSVSEA